MPVIDACSKVASSSKGVSIILAPIWQEVHQMRTSCLEATSIQEMAGGTRQIAAAFLLEEIEMVLVTTRCSFQHPRLNRIRLHIHLASYRALTRIVNQERQASQMELSGHPTRG